MSNKSAIVVHITCLNHWDDWLDVFCQKCSRFGIFTQAFHLYINLKGDPLHLHFARDIVGRYVDSHSSIFFAHLPFDPSDPTEYESLKLVYTLSRSDNYKFVCYIHSKGVTYPYRRDPILYYRMKEWNDAMTDLILGSWQNVLRNLSQNGELFVAGCNFEAFPLPHFSGNFFWLKKDAPVKLPLHPSSLHKDPNDPKRRWRLYYEFWCCQHADRSAVLEIGRSHPKGLVGYHYSNWIFPNYPISAYKP